MYNSQRSGKIPICRLNPPARLTVHNELAGIFGDQRGELRDQKGGIRDLSHGIRISSFLRDQVSGCTIFVGSGTNICYTFGIKVNKFWFKNEISNEKKDP